MSFAKKIGLLGMCLFPAFAVAAPIKSVDLHKPMASFGKPMLQISRDVIHITYMHLLSKHDQVHGILEAGLQEGEWCNITNPYVGEAYLSVDASSNTGIFVDGEWLFQTIGAGYTCARETFALSDGAAGVYSVSYRINANEQEKTYTLADPVQQFFNMS